MVENNKLIAEFLKYKKNTNGEAASKPIEEGYEWYLKDVDYYYISGDWYAEYDLLFRIDWNWLMPAVDKCLVGEADHEPELYFDIIEPIYEALCNINIKETFNSVVKFIKWYNENNIQNEKENSI